MSKLNLFIVIYIIMLLLTHSGLEYTEMGTILNIHAIHIHLMYILYSCINNLG